MNQQDKSFLVTFTGVMTVLVLLAVAIFLISRGVTVLDSAPDDGKRREVTALDRIRPVGTVAVASPAPAGGEAAAPKSGAEVVASVCASCHQAGVLNAPKIGDKAGWEPRLAQGLDALVHNAVNGLNAMPPKGGNPNLSEQEIRNAVVQMLADSGLEAAGGGAAAAPAQEQQAAAGGADLAKGKEVYNGACAACHQAGVLNAPKLGDKAGWEPRLAQGLDALVHNAVNGLNAMPPKGGNPNLSDDDIRNAVAYMVSESGVAMAEAPAAEVAPAAEAAPAGAADPAAAAQAAAEAARQAAEAAQKAAEAAQAAAAAAAQGAGVQAGAAAVEPARAGEPQAAEPAPEATAAEQAAPAQEQAAPAQEQAAPAQEQAAPAQEQAAPAQEQAAPAQEQAAPAQEQAAPAQEQAALPADLDMAKGKQLYNTACVICHQQGVANAPKLGDKESWAPRLEQGFDTLVDHAINGYKGMPPKGGMMDVPDEDIRAAVGYMAQEAR